MQATRQAVTAVGCSRVAVPLFVGSAAKKMGRPEGRPIQISI
jgi:hypothetical protein